jgi:predicted transcriptional regulator
MMSVVSLRLKDAELKKLEELSRMEHKEKSAVARELINYGWEFLMLKQYREGKLSLGSLAEKLNVSVAEVIDLLAELGIEAPIRYEDYLRGLEVLAAQPRNGQ